jgi:hypothetical protein
MMMASLFSPWAMFSPDHDDDTNKSPPARAGSPVKVPNTVAMMRQENFVSAANRKRSNKKSGGWGHHGTSHKQQPGSSSSSSNRSVASSKQNNNVNKGPSKKKSPPPPPSTAKANKNVLKSVLEYSSYAEIDKKRRLWRTHRQKVKRDQQEAILDEKMRLKESDATLQMTEQNKEYQRFMAHQASSSKPVLVVDSLEEGSRYEMVLPRLFNANNDPDSPPEDDFKSNPSKNSSGWNIDGGMWELLDMVTGKFWKNEENADDDSDTASTSDETSMASIASEQTMESTISWQSWNSTETAKVGHCAGTRDIIMQHFGGANDSPWLAAKRGDLNALEFRWKHRHDWTLEDEFGNVPLYYACKYGKNLRLVFFLLQQWPSTQHIPADLLYRCKEDASNIYVQEMLTNPCHAEWIIHDFEANFPQGENDEADEEDFLDDDVNGERLYDIYEGEEEEC